MVRLCLIALASAAHGALLPSFNLKRGSVIRDSASIIRDSGSKSLAQLEREGKWWVRMGDHIYYAPTSLLSLSDRVDHYYHAVGYHSAVTPDLKEHWVGGQGMNHLFYLPEGPSMLRRDVHTGDRRTALSALVQLKAGMVIPETFPQYMLSSSYAHPLSATGQAAEKTAVDMVTEEGVMSFLRNFTGLGPGGDAQPSRSFDSDEASAAATGYLTEQFRALGLATCSHEFEASGRKRQNVIGYFQGSSPESVVIGAHYDSRPYSGLAPGAEDNGSGVASLLAIAQAFAKSKTASLKSVYFVGFAGEEKGLLGSNSFANDLVNSPMRIPSECRHSGAESFLTLKRATPKYPAIILDEVGWISPKSSTPIVNLESYDWTKEVMEHLAQSSKDHNGKALEVVHSSNPFGSDHMSFLDRSQPAVLTINGFDEDYPDYHKSSDRISNVSPTMLKLVSRMNLGGLMRLTGTQ